jgi:hypothetical protein
MLAGRLVFLGVTLAIVALVASKFFTVNEKLKPTRKPAAPSNVPAPILPPPTIPL